MAPGQETIRIIGRDECLRQRQLIEGTSSIAPAREDPVMSSTDGNEDSHILCGSIYSLLLLGGESTRRQNRDALNTNCVESAIFYITDH